MQTLLPACLKLVKEKVIDLPNLFKKLSQNPAQILNIKSGILEEGYTADLVLFDEEKPFLVNRFNLLSKAKNTPFDNYQLYGKVLKTFVTGKEVYKSKAFYDS